MIVTKEVVKNFLEKINPNHILDLGCGSARFSKEFAKKGSIVTGVDKRDLNFEHKNFNFINSDIRDFKFKEKYDLTIASFILHFFKKAKAKEILKNIKNNAQIGGHNLLVCMSNKDNFYKEKPENFYPSVQDLKEIYRDWEIIDLLQDFTEFEEHDNLPRHQHNLIIVLAKKLN